jgi:hypothetical protein
LRILFRFFFDFFFNRHVVELVGVEDLSAIQALDVFDILFARYHAHPTMLAHCVHPEK